MPAFKIVTDTNVNLPQDLVSRFDIRLVPAYVIFGEDQYREAVDITTYEVIERLKRDNEFPKTSQPSPADFEKVYREILEENPDTVIFSIHLTGESSGTVASARTAAIQFPEAEIHVFDSRLFSIGQALMVKEVAAMIDVGAAVDAILAKLNDMRERIQIFFVLDTLDFLHKGGRLGRAAHLIGSMLDIKPILTVKDGVMESYAKMRTRAQATHKLKDMALKAGEGVKEIRLAIAYAIHQSDAIKMADELSKRLHLSDILVTEIGPALGVYTGPGALGVAWYTPKNGS